VDLDCAIFPQNGRDAMLKRLILAAGLALVLIAPAFAASELEKRALTTPGIILMLMLLILIGAMFIGFNYSREAGFFTMAIFGGALLMLVGYVFG
jgi:hypothetical protein